MRIIELFYITTTLASIVTALLQFKNSRGTKNSEKFSLSSWIAPLAAQLTVLVCVISIASVHYLLVNILWMTFYASMILLIRKYRSGAQKELAYARVKQINDRNS
jgi:hypothetical protein